MNSAIEQLAPSSRSRGPLVHTLLAVEADLAGGPPSVDTARRDVLQWMVERVGGLPEAAHRGESFDHLPDGNKAQATRIMHPETDWWSARVEDFVQAREDGIHRVFVTEIAVVAHRGRGRLGLRQFVVTSEMEPAVAPSVPRFLRQLAGQPGLCLGGRDLVPSPKIVATDDDADDLIELIEDPRRRLPVVVASLPAEQMDPGKTAINMRRLQLDALGLAHVAVITDHLTYTLRNHWGQPWSCYNRAVRVYQPSFDPAEQQPYDHPLFLAERIAGWFQANGCTFVEHLRRNLGQASVRRLRTEQQIPRFATVRQAFLEKERMAARQAGRSDTDLLRLADEELQALRQQLEEQGEQALKALIEEEAKFNAAEMRAREAEARYTALLRRVHCLEERIGTVGVAGEAAPLHPASLAEIEAWCDEHLAGLLVLTPRAVRAAKKAEFEDVNLVFDALNLLAREYRDFRIHGEARRECYEQRLAELYLFNEPTGGDVQRCGDTFRLRYEGGNRVLDMHLKNGGNTHDTRRCFRLYYFWDDVQQLCVVGSLPAHLRTGAT